MNTDFLRTLIAVAEHGSMAEAARRLGLTHGAVAQQIRVLEADWGVPLVARAGRTVHLTDRAEQLLIPVREALERVDRIRQLARTDDITGELRLGAGQTALNSVVPVILKMLLARYPRVRVDLRPGHSSDFYPAIERGDLDAAIALEAPYTLPKRLGWQLLREEPHVLVAAAHHAGQDPHALLRTLPFIRYDRAHWGGRQIEDYLQRCGIPVQERFELNAIESIAAMASQDLGVAILPMSTNGVIERLGLATLSLPLPCAPRRFGLIWSRASPRQVLIDVVRDAAAREYARVAAPSG